jgi:2-aminoadipate transaminase
MLAALEAHAPRGVRWTRPPGGLSVWLTLPDGLDAEELLPAALERGVAFAPATGFYPGEPALNHLRLTFGSASPEELQRGVAILCDLIRARLRA